MVVYTSVHKLHIHLNKVNKRTYNFSNMNTNITKQLNKPVIRADFFCRVRMYSARKYIFWRPTYVITTEAESHRITRPACHPAPALPLQFGLAGVICTTDDGGPYQIEGMDTLEYQAMPSLHDLAYGCVLV